MKDDHLRLLVFLGNLLILGAIGYVLFDTFWVARRLDPGRVALEEYVIKPSDAGPTIDPDRVKIVWETLEPQKPVAPVEHTEPKVDTPPPKPREAPITATLTPALKAILVGGSGEHSAVVVTPGKEEEIIRQGTDLGKWWSQLRGVILQEFRIVEENGERDWAAVFLEPNTKKEVVLKIPRPEGDERISFK